MLIIRDKALNSNSLVLSYAEVTDTGGRQANQDALAAAEQDDLACFVVSDGVGGQAGGEIASNIIVEAVIGSFLREASFGPRALRSYIERAAVEVRNRKSEDERLREMSATVAAVLVDRKNRTALWAHLGDTRVYLFRRNRIHTMTRDHSLVQQLVDEGYCSPADLRTHPQRSALCAAIAGDGEDIPEVTEAAITIEAGDAFLVCTDGFWEWITEPEMERAAASTDSAQGWLEMMRALVEENGGLSTKPCDNYTAFAICLDESTQ
ncbi:MAG: family protein phosphatase [Burkholderiales bacterium]|jgi:serine/threonine protein phosphatase PrpC